MTAQLLKGREVAERLNISLNTLYRLADEGHIRSIRVGKRLRRFDPAAVEEFLNRAAPEDAA